MVETVEEYSKHPCDCYSEGDGCGDSTVVSIVSGLKLSPIPILKLEGNNSNIDEEYFH